MLDCKHAKRSEGMGLAALPAGVCCTSVTSSQRLHPVLQGVFVRRKIQQQVCKLRFSTSVVEAFPVAL